MRMLARFAVALGLLFSAPAFADKTSDASYKEGLAYKTEGKIDEAIKAMKDAVAQNPKHVMAWASLGSLYKQKMPTEKSKDDKAKDLDLSIDAYEHATQITTKDPVLWTNLGTAYANAGKLDQALTALTTACKLNPKDPEIRAYLGTVMRKKNDYNGAITNLEIAVKLKPDNPDWQHNLGVAYRFAKRDDDAIAAFQRAIALNPNDATYHFDLGVAYRRKQDPDKAIPEYEKAVALDPGNTETLFDLAFMYKENHENDKAILTFQKYLEQKKGKDPEGEKRVTEECQALGGCKDAAKKGGGKTPPRKK